MVGADRDVVPSPVECTSVGAVESPSPMHRRIVVLGRHLRSARAVTLDPRTPVIIGVGQYNHRADSLDDALEPAALMERAVLAAAADAGLDGPPAADSVRVVSQSSAGATGNAPRFLADRLGLVAAPNWRRPRGRQQPAVAGEPHRARHPGRRHRRRRSSPAPKRSEPGHACAQGGRGARLAEGRTDDEPTDRRRRARHEPPGRDARGIVTAGADLPDVRNGDPGGGGSHASRSIKAISADSGPTSARSQRATRTRGSAMPEAPERDHHGHERRTG